MRRTLLCVFVLWISACSATRADQVTLKNGDRLSGTIVSADGKTLLLKTEFAGDVTIQWAAITAIDSTQNLHLTLKDGKQLSGKVSTSDGTLTVAPITAAAGAAGSAPKDAIVAVRNDAEEATFDEQAEKMAHPKFYYFWSGVFDTGLALTRGNSETASYTLSGSGVRQTPRDKLSLFASYIFANDDTAPPTRTTANEFNGGIRGDLNLSPKFFVFALANFQTNELQNLSLRQVYGGGFGYHVLKSARNTFDVFGGISFDRDEFSAYSLVNPTPPPPTIAIAAIDKNSAEALIGEQFASKFSAKSTLTETFTIYPNLSHTGEYRFQFNSNMATQVKGWLSWQITFNDTYISYPPPGLKGNDLVLSTGFRATLGNPAK
jgi:putative salt-induced outer membrane protein YdiY